MLRAAIVGMAVALLALTGGVASAAPWRSAEVRHPHHGHGPGPFGHPGPGVGRIGASGLGDPFFPLAGNGGYDVGHYSLRLSYDPGPRLLDGAATITATATQDLARFDLDLRGFAVSDVRVDGRPAVVTRDGQELQITPARVLGKGSSFVVSLAYRGVPEVVTDPDGSIEGWVPTSDGAFVVGEPQGSPSWFPGNDNPRDKATYDIAITVPDGLTATSNGVLSATWSRAGRTTWAWREDSPMATYLATATLGRFQLTRSRIAGVPAYVAVDPSQAADAAPALARLPEIVSYFGSVFGRYPFDAVGAIVDDAPEVGYALESQTKPVFDRAPDDITLAHEIAHQWYGDSVSLTRWPDIWLNEGFATYAEWLWGEHTGQFTAQEAFDDLYSDPGTASYWNPPPNALSDPTDLFSDSVYVRGAMTLHALRMKVGDPVFFRILRRWYAANRDGNVTTADFIALAERESGRDLRAFFTAWLTRPGKPLAW